MFVKELQFWRIGSQNRRGENNKVSFDESDMWDDYISPYANKNNTIDQGVVKRNVQLQSD
jgi:hypothetical protein